jgi:hypothetical protein
MHTPAAHADHTPAAHAKHTAAAHAKHTPDAHAKETAVAFAKHTPAVWLDRATIQFRFFGPSSFNTALQLVMGPHFLVHFV